jgi:hypothetical protein
MSAAPKPEMPRPLALVRPDASDADNAAVLNVVDPTWRLKLKAEEQALDARHSLTGDPSAAVAWPWPDLDALLPPMVPGTFHVGAAFSGTGKTTLLLSAMRCWLDAEIPIYIAPLETSPTVWRLLWAAMELADEFPDLDPGDVKTLRLQARADAGDARAVTMLQALDDEVARLAKRYGDLLFVEDRITRLTPSHILAGCRFAGQQGFRLAIFDHLDRTDAASDVNPFREAQLIAAACDRGAKEYRVAVLGTKQCNQDIVRGPDKLARYQPPRESHVQFGGGTRQEAESMFGIFRPLRGRAPDEQPYPDGKRRVDPYLDRLKAARAGLIPPHTMLMPNVSGINCMKNRPYGRLEGHSAFLRYHRGRNEALTPAQRFELEQAEHAIATTGAGA